MIASIIVNYICSVLFLVGLYIIAASIDYHSFDVLKNQAKVRMPFKLLFFRNKKRPNSEMSLMAFIFQLVSILLLVTVTIMLVFALMDNENEYWVVGFACINILIFVFFLFPSMYADKVKKEAYRLQSEKNENPNEDKKNDN